MDQSDGNYNTVFLLFFSTFFGRTSRTQYRGWYRTRENRVVISCTSFLKLASNRKYLRIDFKHRFSVTMEDNRDLYHIKLIIGVIFFIMLSFWLTSCGLHFFLKFIRREFFTAEPEPVQTPSIDNNRSSLNSSNQSENGISTLSSDLPPSYSDVTRTYLDQAITNSQELQICNEVVPSYKDAIKVTDELIETYLHSYRPGIWTLTTNL